MIPKANKFPTRTQFLSFRARAKQLNTPHLRFLFEERPSASESSLSGPRLSVIVPIKVNKRATTRNRFKRLVYDTAWKQLGSRNLDCIIMFKPLALLKGPASEHSILSELIGLKF
jgi:ribonuclease P protein component